MQTFHVRTFSLPAAFQEKEVGAGLAAAWIHEEPAGADVVLDAVGDSVNNDKWIAMRFV
jgi:hypothetical protein